MSTKPKKLPPIIYVEWVDAVASAGWEKEAHGADLCHAVGFVVADTKQHLTLAVTVSGGQHNARLAIPKGWIKKRKRLALG